MNKYISRDISEPNHMFGEQPHKNNHNKAKRHSHLEILHGNDDQDGQDRHKYNRSEHKNIIYSTKDNYLSETDI